MIYGYSRVSTEEQGAGTSLKDQERKIRGVAMVLGEEDVEMYSDVGVSGGTPMQQREEGGYLFDALAEGDTLIVAKLDRAFRSAEDALVKARELQERGVDLILADIGTDPVTSNGVGKLFFTMLAGLAEFERDRIRERTADGRAAKKNAGGHTGGRAPFGYRVEGKGRSSRLVPIPEEQDAIAFIEECLREGWSLRKTAEAVQEEKGLSVSFMTVKRIKRDMEASNG